MRTVRTTLRPDVEQQVDDEEAEVLRAHGLLLLLIVDATPAEEVTSSGESEERDGLQGSPGPDREEDRSEPGPGGGDPGELDAQGLPEGQASQSEPEKGPEEEGLI